MKLHAIVVIVRRIGQRLSGWWTPVRLGAVLLAFAALIWALNCLNQRGLFCLPETLRRMVIAFDNSATIELISLAITILVVNRLYQHQETKREKRRLILQMGSPDNAFALEAARALDSHGWLSNGSLERAWLVGANLQQARLIDADLRLAYLWAANLQGAQLTLANLKGADLKSANLKGADLSFADLQGANLARVEYNNDTAWPEGFTPPPDAVNVDAEGGRDSL